VNKNQATTGSVVRGSRAFVAGFTGGLNENPAFVYLGDSKRRNAMTNVYVRDGRNLVLAHLDFPKTHDADSNPEQGYSFAKIFELVPSDVSH
jgi:hypothetical protein